MVKSPTNCKNSLKCFGVSKVSFKSVMTYTNLQMHNVICTMSFAQCPVSCFDWDFLSFGERGGANCKTVKTCQDCQICVKSVNLSKVSKFSKCKCKRKCQKEKMSKKKENI